MEKTSRNIEMGDARRLQAAAHALGQGTQPAHQGVNWSGDGLRTVAFGVGRIVVDLNDQTVRPSGHGRHTHPFYHPGLAAGVGGVHHHGEMGEFLDRQHGREIQRVAGKVSKVRMPRSQRITRSLPPAMMYSADMSHSSMVEERPRLSRSGLGGMAELLEQIKILCSGRPPG